MNIFVILIFGKDKIWSPLTLISQEIHYQPEKLNIYKMTMRFSHVRGEYSAKCLNAGEAIWMKWDTLSQFPKQIPFHKYLFSIIKSNVKVPNQWFIKKHMQSLSVPEVSWGWSQEISSANFLQEATGRNLFTFLFPT